MLDWRKGSSRDNFASRGLFRDQTGRVAEENRRRCPDDGDTFISFATSRPARRVTVHTGWGSDSSTHRYLNRSW